MWSGSSSTGSTSARESSSPCRCGPGCPNSADPRRRGTRIRSAEGRGDLASAHDRSGRDRRGGGANQRHRRCAGDRADGHPVGSPRPPVPGPGWVQACRLVVGLTRGYTGDPGLGGIVTLRRLSLPPLLRSGRPATRLAFALPLRIEPLSLRKASRGGGFFCEPGAESLRELDVLLPKPTEVTDMSTLKGNVPIGRHIQLRVAVLSIGLFLLMGCASTPVEIDQATTGDLYGKLYVASLEPASPGGALVRVEGTNFSARADADGLFYIPDVPVGNYYVVASLEGFRNDSLKGVEVSADSLSFVTNLSIHRITETSRGAPAIPWRGAKIKRVPLSLRGSIAGTVYNTAGHPQPGAGVSVSGALWYTKTDSTGQYRIEGVLPGTYRVGSAFDYENNHGGESGVNCSVQIAEDATIVVDLRTTSSWIEPPYPPCGYIRLQPDVR